MRQPVLLREPGSFWKSLWKPPDHFLLEAGAAGEMLVARIRLLLTTILLLIPLVSLWYEQETWENLVGLAVTLTAFLVALLWFWLVQQGIYRHWLGLASSLLDVTLVSLALFVFVLLDRPPTAVNSKVTFEAYFLAIAATCLRHDVRICVLAGLSAITQYALIVTCAATMWDLLSRNLQSMVVRSGTGDFDGPLLLRDARRLQSTLQCPRSIIRCPATRSRDRRLSGPLLGHQ